MIYVGDVRIGRVMRFEAHKPSERWVAIARTAKLSDPENKERFRTKRAAEAWLESEAEKLDFKYA